MGEQYQKHPEEHVPTTPTIQNAVQHPHFERESIQKAPRPPMSTVPPLFRGEGEDVQAVCTHNVESVISLFGILMVEINEGQSAAHTHT